MAAAVAPAPATNGDNSKTGILWKQGGSYRNWKKRYFVLKGNSLEYYKSEGDGSPKGTIDLTKARGVRTREQCDLEWPDKARPGRSFGVAVENRTFYMYGEDSAVTAAAITQEQCEAEDDVSIQQRLLMAGATTLDGAAEIVGEENEIAGGVLSTAAGVTRDQAEADSDMSVQQRLILAGGSTLEGVSGMVEDEILADTLEVAGGVVKDQAEADLDTSVKERVAMAVGSAAGGVADLDSMRYNYDGQGMARGIERGAEKVGEMFAEDEDSQE